MKNQKNTLEETQLIIIPTRVCNLNCRYCHVEKKHLFLQEKVALDSIRNFINSGGKSIKLTGSEPLCNWSMVSSILKLCKQHADRAENIEVELCTNGTLLTDDKLKELDYKWVTVTVSIDGRAETYLKNRGDVKFKTFLNLLDTTKKLIEQRNLQHFVTMTISPEDCENFFEDFIFLWSQGIRNYNFLPVYYREWKSRQLRNLKDSLSLIAKFIKPHLKKKTVRIRNLENKGFIPLFSNSVCLDSDGKYYFTNAVMLKAIKKHIKSLELGSNFEQLGQKVRHFLTNKSLENIFSLSFSRQTMKANGKVDSILTGFVMELGGKKKTTKKQSRTNNTGKRPERLEIHMSYRCVNSCIFCSEHHRILSFKGKDLKATEIFKVLISHSSAGGRHVNFTGGEPTLHSYFPQLIESAKHLGLTVYVGTNGIMLHNYEYAKMTVPFIDELSLSIHGPDSKIHGACTKNPESFNWLVKTAENVVKIKPEIFLMANTVVVKDNVAHILETIQLCIHLGVKNILVSNPAPEGRALDNYRDIAVPLNQWKEITGKIVSMCNKHNVTIRFFGVPACILGIHAIKSNDFYFDPRVTVERARRKEGRIGYSTIITRLPRRGRRKIGICYGCKYHQLCGGIFTEYIRIFGTTEITPPA